MMMFLGIDRRQFSRTDVVWPVSMLTAKGSINGTVKNISPGGALISCNELPNLRKPIRMGIEIPEYNHAIIATGQVVRSHICETDGVPNVDSTSPSYALGVQFIEAPEEDIEFFIGDETIKYKNTLDTANQEKDPEQNFPQQAEYSLHAKVKESESDSKPTKQTNFVFILITAALMLLLIPTIMVISTNYHEMETNQVKSLQARVKQLEANLTSLEVINGRLAQIEQQDRDLTSLGDRFNRLEASLTRKTFETLDQHTGVQYHQVRVGETLYRISRLYGLTVEELSRLNGLGSGALIYPGQKLIVSPENR